MSETPYFPWSLQLSLRARRRFAAGLPATAPRLFRLRLLAQRLHADNPAVSGGVAELQLLAQLNTALRFMAQRYLQLRQGAIARDHLRLGGVALPFASLPPTLAAFVRLFPPGETVPDDPAAWLQAAAAPQRSQQALVELQVLAVQNDNRAVLPLRPLFDDRALRAVAPYPALLAELDRLLLRAPAAGPFALPLTELLRQPLRVAPDSLAGQLRFVRAAWGEWLPAELLVAIDSAFDLLAEEEQSRGGGPGPAPVLAPDAGLGGEAPERFSPDSDWMPNVVLLAKTIYVWLDQLSRQYGRQIERLDRIPEEELALLARRGFTALWLIGIWERSPASAAIKRRMGNPEAAPSAYSLFDYTIAHELGGEAALQTLRERCRAHGLRLGCDVVPNHTGLDSRWVREHPDWYVQVDHPPYPAYSFSGPNLASAPDLELRIEDGYWSHRDAAVVFQHIQHGRVRYLYHGNDGTHLPWNDTAQLNFLLPAVREAMIELIVAVARRFPVIRFDAAMTLAKKHYQRLWFPQPGGGAGVPSRAEHAMSRSDFDAAFPAEFWREVVDRVAAEVPDTLLLAEAFWLMEGYFVRTLGMHRVYNSAFMNMLKHEENAKYRAVIKNILAFEPEILKRFVNFMNNPDEDTAAAQFGKGDKYFGVAVLLATLPGLPMFGHGQVEGFEEKYGMEYRRAYRDEEPDAGFVRHHEAQLFPLLRRRRLFSGSACFELYDVETDGRVMEEVFAYSNRHGEGRALVLYHNRAGTIAGRVGRSVVKRRGEGEPAATTLVAALALDAAPYWRCREQKSGQEYLFASAELAAAGLALRLDGYDYRVYLDWRPLPEDGCWGELQRQLGGAGSPELDRLWGRRRYAALHAQLRRLLEPERLRRLAALLATARPRRALLRVEISALACELERLQQALAAAGVTPPANPVAAVVGDLERLLDARQLPARCRAERRLRAVLRGTLATAGDLALLLGWRWLAALDLPPQALLQERCCDEVFAALAEPGAASPAQLLPVLVRQGAALAAPAALPAALAQLVADPAVRAFLGCHSWQGAEYLVQERLQQLCRWLMVGALLAGLAPPRLVELQGGLAALEERAAACGYRVEKIFEFG